MLAAALPLLLGSISCAGTATGTEERLEPPAIGLRVVDQAESPDLEFLVGGLLLRLLQRGYCVTPAAGELVLRVELLSSSRVFELGMGADLHRIRVEGRGELADLELFHRLGAELPETSGLEVKSSCGADSISVSLESGTEIDPELHRHWLSSIWRAGRGLRPGGAQQLCLQRTGGELRLGSGPECKTELRWSVTQDRGLAERLNVIVGASLAMAKQVRERAEEATKPKEDETKKPSAKTPSNKAGRFDKICKIRECGKREPAAPLMLPYGSLGFGGLLRRRGLSGVVHVQVGAMFRVPITVAFDLRMLAASAGEEAVAIDTDLSLALGYVLGLSPRTGLAFGLSAGGRLHDFREEGSGWQGGPSAWVFGASVFNYWRVAKYMQLEIGLTPSVALDGWIHQIGVRSVRELGPSFAGMLTLGLAWKGNAHGDR